MSSTGTHTVVLSDLTPPTHHGHTTPLHTRISSSPNTDTNDNSTTTIPDASIDVNASIEGEDTTSTSLGVGVRTAVIIFQLSAINFLASFANGVIVVGLPAIAQDISLSQELYLWPSSIYGLTSGAALLLAGSIADVVGSRVVDLTGIVAAGVSTLACGLSRTGVQLVIFRGFMGVAMSMHLPCSVSMVTQTVPSGKPRNIAFSCLGLSQPLGFSFGLVLGGVFVDTTGWRTGFYVPGASILAFAALGFFVLAAPDTLTATKGKLHGLKTKVDWVGAIIASGGLAMLSYVLAVLSADSESIEKPNAIALLVTSVVLMAAFPFWIRIQERKRRPALIPNSIWKNRAFTSVCVTVLLSTAVMNSMELFSSLFFQEVQSLSAIQASLRLLPALIFGTVLNLSTGLLVDRLPVLWLVLVASICTAGSPLLMALISPRLDYWRGAFFAQVLEPTAGDILYTVGLIVISDGFPEQMQGLAGAVFSTVSQFGISLGLSTMQVISNLVTEETKYRDKSSPPALLKGYRASFWAMFGAMILSCFVAAFGFRKAGKVGLKRE
ncbi:hypothetical protein LTS17_001240 [Exophiala oligosperma]